MSADDCKVMECITGLCSVFTPRSPPIPPMYLHFCVSAGSNSAWMCSLLVALLACPSSIYAFIYLTFQLHIFAQKRVPNGERSRCRCRCWWRWAFPKQCNVNAQHPSKGLMRMPVAALAHTKFLEVRHVFQGRDPCKILPESVSLLWLPKFSRERERGLHIS